MKRIALPYLEGFLFLAILLCSCGSESTTPIDTDTPDLAKKEPDLEVVVDLGRLRDAPSPEGNILSQLEKGARLQDLGQVSGQTTRIQYGTEKFDEPWLQVRQADGQTGWIYAREVAPSGPTSVLTQFRQNKQLQSIFGAAAYQGLQEFQSLWNEANTEDQLAKAYHEGSVLRDTLSSFLEKKSYSYTDSPLPDLFWIGNYIPGYVPQLVAEGTVYYLFHDYDQWLQEARKSRGQQDDRFFTLMVKCFPQDSIEYFFPAWEMQTWDYGGHSLLGRGIAYEILSTIEQIQPQTPLFSKDLQALKDQILNSITQPDIHFWEPDTLVTRELDAIIQANWRIFTVTDRIALKTRRQQLDSAAVHGIRFNARSGEE